MDELSQEHQEVLDDPQLLELRESAQRAYAWLDYLETTPVAGHDVVDARLDWERAAWELDNELALRGFERTEDIDSALWAAPLSEAPGFALWPTDGPQAGVER